MAICGLTPKWNLIYSHKHISWLLLLSFKSTNWAGRVAKKLKPQSEQWMRSLTSQSPPPEGSLVFLWLKSLWSRRCKNIKHRFLLSWGQRNTSNKVQSHDMNISLLFMLLISPYSNSCTSNYDLFKITCFWNQHKYKLHNKNKLQVQVLSILREKCTGDNHKAAVCISNFGV